MKSENFPAPRKQSVVTEKFFFYFVGLRKAEIKRQVDRMRRDHPDESPEQLARRLTNAAASLSLLGGAMLNLSTLLPGVGQVLRILGLTTATAVLTSMHVFLILEIAMLFGRDIDDQARVPEMLAIIGATGLASSTPLVLRSLGLKSPWLAGPAGLLTVGAVSRLIGEASIRYYSRASDDEALQAVPTPVDDPSPPG